MGFYEDLGAMGSWLNSQGQNVLQSPAAQALYSLGQPAAVASGLWDTGNAVYGFPGRVMGAMYEGSHPEQSAQNILARPLMAEQAVQESRQMHAPLTLEQIQASASDRMKQANAFMSGGQFAGPGQEKAYRGSVLDVYRQLSDAMGPDAAADFMQKKYGMSGLGTGAETAQQQMDRRWREGTSAGPWAGSF